MKNLIITALCLLLFSCDKNNLSPSGQIVDPIQNEGLETMSWSVGSKSYSINISDEIGRNIIEYPNWNNGTRYVLFTKSDAFQDNIMINFIVQGNPELNKDYIYSSEGQYFAGSMKLSNGKQIVFDRSLMNIHKNDSILSGEFFAYQARIMPDNKDTNIVIDNGTFTIYK